MYVGCCNGIFLILLATLGYTEVGAGILLQDCSSTYECQEFFKSYTPFNVSGCYKKTQVDDIGHICSFNALKSMVRKTTATGPPIPKQCTKVANEKHKCHRLCHEDDDIVFQHTDMVCYRKDQAQAYYCHSKKAAGKVMCGCAHLADADVIAGQTKQPGESCF